MPEPHDILLSYHTYIWYYISILITLLFIYSNKYMPTPVTFGYLNV